MNVCRAACGQIRPEKRILQLKFYNTRRFAIAFREVKQSGEDIHGDALRPQFIRPPHSHASLNQPLSRFIEDSVNRCGIASVALSDDAVHSASLDACHSAGTASTTTSVFTELAMKHCSCAR